MPNSIESFSLRTISSCNSFERVYLPKSFKVLSDLGIRDCDELNEFCVDITNSNLCCADGVIFNKDMLILIRYPASKKDISYIVPESVLIID